MPRKKKTPENNKDIYQALFALTAREGWWALTLPKIARAAKIPLSELLKTVPDKNALLAGFAAQTDRNLAETNLEDATSLKERLFEIMMRRFELLQEYRPGFTRLMDDIMANPLAGACLALELVPRARRSLRLVLELAEFPLREPLTEIAVVGLKLVHLQALRAWKNDSSTDLSSTMAALDRGLDRFLSFLRLI